jgi:hypothetical protein
VPVTLEQRFSNCGPQTTDGPQQSSGCLGRKIISKILTDTEGMKNTPIHVYAKTAFVG